MYLYLVTFNDQFCVEALASKRRWFQLPLDSTDKSIVVTQATVESRGASTSSCHGSSSYRSARSSVTSGSLGNKSTETDDDSGHLLSTSTCDDAGGEQWRIDSVCAVLPQSAGWVVTFIRSHNHTELAAVCRCRRVPRQRRL